jgi:hypothetical protein
MTLQSIWIEDCFYDTEREAAIAADAFIIKQGGEPINIENPEFLTALCRFLSTTIFS